MHSHARGYTWVRKQVSCITKPKVRHAWYETSSVLQTTHPVSLRYTVITRHLFHGLSSDRFVTACLNNKVQEKLSLCMSSKANGQSNALLASTLYGYEWSSFTHRVAASPGKNPPALFSKCISGLQSKFVRFWRREKSFTLAGNRTTTPRLPTP